MVKKFYVTKKKSSTSTTSTSPLSPSSPPSSSTASSSSSSSSSSASASASSKLSPLDKAKDAFIQILADLSSQSQNQYLALSTFDGFVTSTLNELLGRNEVEEDEEAEYYDDEESTGFSLTASSTDISECSDTLSNASGASGPAGGSYK